MWRMSARGSILLSPDLLYTVSQHLSHIDHKQNDKFRGKSEHLRTMTFSPCVYNPNFLCVFSVRTLDAPKSFPWNGTEYAKALGVWHPNLSFIRVHTEPGAGE